MRRVTPIALLLGALLLVGSAGLSRARAGRRRPAMTYFERLSLANWKDVMRVEKASGFWKPTGMILIAAKPDQVMATFMDFKSYSAYMPKVKSCRVVRRRGKSQIWALVILHLPWPVANAWVAVKYTWQMTLDGAYHLRWVRHRGSMKRYWGALTLMPWGKYWTLAICTMQAVPDAHVSRSRLNGGIVWGTRALLHALRAEVDRRRRKGCLKSFNP